MKIPRKVAIGLFAIGIVGTGVIAPSFSAAGSQAPGLANAVPLSQHPGKILAGNCFQCHGTDGKNGAFDSLAGKPADELFKELKELQTKPDLDKAMMRVHANAYSDAQLRLIADYFSQVR